MDLRAKFGLNQKLEADGIDLHLGGDAFITVRPAGMINRRYAAKVNELLQRERRTSLGDLDADTLQAVMLEAYGAAVCVGWRGMELDGQALECTPENFRRLMRELPALWEIVQREAGNLANFRSAEVEQLGKRSATG